MVEAKKKWRHKSCTALKIICIEDCRGVSRLLSSVLRRMLLPASLYIGYGIEDLAYVPKNPGRAKSKDRIYTFEKFSIVRYPSQKNSKEIRVEI